MASTISRNWTGSTNWALRVDLVVEVIQELHLPCYAVSIPILGKYKKVGARLRHA